MTFFLVYDCFDIPGRYVLNKLPPWFRRRVSARDNHDGTTTIRVKGGMPENNKCLLKELVRWLKKQRRHLEQIYSAVFTDDVSKLIQEAMLIIDAHAEKFPRKDHGVLWCDFETQLTPYIFGHICSMLQWLQRCTSESEAHMAGLDRLICKMQNVFASMPSNEEFLHQTRLLQLFVTNPFVLRPSPVAPHSLLHAPSPPRPSPVAPHSSLHAPCHDSL